VLTTIVDDVEHFESVTRILFIESARVQSQDSAVSISLKEDTKQP
jgi:hypothetical protein